MAEQAVENQETEAKETSSLSKAQKAALIFLFLEEKGAASLFQHMSDDEIKVIGSTLLRMDEIPVDEMNIVLGEFHETLDVPGASQITGKKIFEKLVTKSLPEDRQGKIFSIADIRGGQGSRHNPLESMFVVMTPEATYDLIKNEHPQTIAVILTLIKPKLSKQVISYFDEDLKTNILYRMSTLSKIQEDVILVLEETFKSKISTFGEIVEKTDDGEGIDVPGVDLVLKYLRSQPWEQAEKIIAEIEEDNSDVAKVLRKKIFTLEDLLRTDNNGIRNLLKNVETGALSIALKKAAPAVQNKIFQNMSSRAAAILKEDMEVMKDPKPEDIELATDKILDEAKQLIKDGEIELESLKDE